MCARISDQVAMGLAEIARPVVYRYGADGSRIDDGEGASQDSRALEDAGNLDAYGELQSMEFSGRSQWEALEAEPEEALQYNRARCYDPTVGRWLSGEPLAFGGSEEHRYRYPSRTEPIGKTPSDGC